MDENRLITSYLSFSYNYSTLQLFKNFIKKNIQSAPSVV